MRSEVDGVFEADGDDGNDEKVEAMAACSSRAGERSDNFHTDRSSAPGVSTGDARLVHQHP